MKIEEFRAQFAFTREYAFKIGVERECFIVEKGGSMPIPRAHALLPYLQTEAGSAIFDKELSACQLESRVGPIVIEKLEKELTRVERVLCNTMEQFGCRPSYQSVGPESMSTEVYPIERYRNLVKQRSREEVLAACRVIGTHVHIGMPDHETALRVYNAVRLNTVGLCGLGDRSNGERLTIYKSFAPDWLPPAFDGWPDLLDFAHEKNFAHDLRSWWGLVRISCHGTIEFRMFDATNSIADVVVWAKVCRALCLAAR